MSCTLWVDVNGVRQGRHPVRFNLAENGRATNVDPIPIPVGMSGAVGIYDAAEGGNLVATCRLEGPWVVVRPEDLSEWAEWPR